MIRRAVEISREPCSLITRDEQLLILRREREPARLPADPPNLAGSIPCEDLGVLIVDERDTTYSHGALTKLAEHGCTLVVCGRDHLPIGVYVSLPRNTDLLARLDAQLSASRPIRKRLWARIVAAKIRAQAANLAHAPETRSRLLAVARSVRSGDPDNAEARAAQLYWPRLFRDVPHVTQPFRRAPGDPGALPPNNLLDYAYAVLRAALARSIVAAGLLPAIGLRHAGRSNYFCLADDLIEPLRPLADRVVLDLARRAELRLNQPTKAELISSLWMTVGVADMSGPLQVSMARYIASYVQCLTGERRDLEIPAAIRQSAAPGASPGHPPEHDDDEPP